MKKKTKEDNIRAVCNIFPWGESFSDQLSDLSKELAERISGYSCVFFSCTGMTAMTLIMNRE